MYKDFSLDNSTDCLCVVMMDEIYPRDIWELHTPFGELARWIGYGKRDLLVSKQNSLTLVPKTSHYVWTGDHELKYYEYISILSCLYVADMDIVYIHGETEPRGKYWEMLKTERVEHIITRHPERIFSNNVIHSEQLRDFLRLDILLKYGGVYQDLDVFWVNPISDKIRSYDAVLGFDWSLNKIWPETFNLGVLITKKNAEYL